MKNVIGTNKPVNIAVNYSHRFAGGGAKGGGTKGGGGSTVDPLLAGRKL